MRKKKERTGRETPGNLCYLFGRRTILKKANSSWLAKGASCPRQLMFEGGGKKGKGKNLEKKPKKTIVPLGTPSWLGGHV